MGIISVIPSARWAAPNSARKAAWYRWVAAVSPSKMASASSSHARYDSDGMMLRAPSSVSRSPSSAPLWIARTPHNVYSGAKRQPDWTASRIGGTASVGRPSRYSVAPRLYSKTLLWGEYTSATRRWLTFASRSPRAVALAHSMRARSKGLAPSASLSSSRRCTRTDAVSPSCARPATSHTRGAMKSGASWTARSICGLRALKEFIDGGHIGYAFDKGRQVERFCNATGSRLERVQQPDRDAANLPRQLGFFGVRK